MLHKRAAELRIIFILEKNQRRFSSNNLRGIEVAKRIDSEWLDCLQCEKQFDTKLGPQDLWFKELQQNVM